MIDLAKITIPKKGALWRMVSGYFESLLSGLSQEPKRIRSFFDVIIREMNPGTAIDMQPEWYQLYGLIYDDSKTIEEQQGETLERFTALGGQDIVYLQDKIEKAGFTSVTLVENISPGTPTSNVCGIARTGVARCFGSNGWGTDWIFHYFVTGTVADKKEFQRLRSLLQKLAPAHLIPVFRVLDSDNVCGVARCGVAICDG